MGFDHKELSIKNRKIALVLDNATYHPKLEFSNIELVFLPANTSSHTQLLDQGVIANLNAGEKSAYNIFDALEVLYVSLGTSSHHTP